MKKINDILLNPIVCAPLAGISNDAYRALCLKFGAGLVYTEMTSSEAIHYRNIKTFNMCNIAKDNHPIALQLFGARPSIMEEAAIYIDKECDADIIDINMGCPAPKVVKTGAGAALMRTPEIAYEMVYRIVQAVHKPVTVKIRLGWSESEKNYLNFAKGLEKAGASAIALHARTRAQMYEGKADWQAIALVKENLNIPVIGNGDIRNSDDFFKYRESSNADAVMIGRALVGNPFLIDEINNRLHNLNNTQIIDFKKRREACLFHATRLIAQVGEDSAMREMRGIVPAYLKGLTNASKFKMKSAKLSTLNDLKSLLDEYELSLDNNSCQNI